jgi:hypothetical protein
VVYPYCTIFLCFRIGLYCSPPGPPTAKNQPAAVFGGGWLTAGALPRGVGCELDSGLRPIAAAVEARSAKLLLYSKTESRGFFSFRGCSRGERGVVVAFFCAAGGPRSGCGKPLPRCASGYTVLILPRQINGFRTSRFFELDFCHCYCYITAV